MQRMPSDDVSFVCFIIGSEFGTPVAVHLQQPKYWVLFMCSTMFSLYEPKRLQASLPLMGYCMIAPLYSLPQVSGTVSATLYKMSSSFCFFIRYPAAVSWWKMVVRREWSRFGCQAQTSLASSVNHPSSPTVLHSREMGCGLVRSSMWDCNSSHPQ